MKILLIQTAFLGDAILATAVLEKLRDTYPEADLDLLVQRGNESLFQAHPYLRQVWTFDKKHQKYRSLWKLLWRIRRAKYDWVINLHRFASSGLLTAFSGAKRRCGFRKNPFSWGFTYRAEHIISAAGPGPHEVERNQALIAPWTDAKPASPRLYPSASDLSIIPSVPYFCLAPASVWATKQYPPARWVALIDRLPKTHRIYLLGGPGDTALASDLALRSRHPDVRMLAGEISLLQSAALLSGAVMNFVNDSAPLHLASAMNAPVTAVFCSTVPAFGFTPLSDLAFVVESSESLACRPCGLHGHQACPEGHFRCADIPVERLLAFQQGKPER